MFDASFSCSWEVEMMRGDTTNVFLVARREWWVILLFVWAGAGAGDVVHYGATVVPRCLSIKTRDTTLRYQADSGLRHWSAHITISITIPTLNPLDFVADFLSFHFLRLLKPIEMSFGGAGKQSWKKLHRISLLHFGISNTSYLDNTISTLFHRFQRRSWWSVRDHRLPEHRWPGEDGGRPHRERWSHAHLRPDQDRLVRGGNLCTSGIVTT